MSQQPIIRLEGVEKTYYLGEVVVRALRGVSLEVMAGDYIAIMGPSGSGKSTMLNLLGCLDRPSAGHYYLGGEDVSQMSDNELSSVRGQRLGFIFQSYNLVYQLTVVENIQVPLVYQGLDTEKNNSRCEALAGLVGLEERLDHRPQQLSGGQQQRVAIARSLVNDPLMILADEPTGNLDSKTGVEILEMMDQLNAAGKTIVLVTHDPKTAARAHRVVHMKDGVIDRIETPPRRDITKRDILPKMAPADEAVSFGALVLSKLRMMKLGLKSLMLHKLRAALTMLGIIFGVCSVIAMLAIGEGASYEAQQSIKRLGSRNIIARAIKPAEDNKSGANDTGRASVVDYGLTYKDAIRVAATIPGIERVLPERIRRDNIRYFRQNIPGQIIGTDPAYAEIKGLEIVRGRFITDIDEEYQNNVCAISESLAERLFLYEDPLEKELKVDAFYFKVVGVVRETSGAKTRPQSGDNSGQALDSNVYIPISASKSRFGETLIRITSGGAELERVELHEMIVQFKESANIEVAVPEMKTLFKRFHTKNDYEFIVPLELLREAEATKRRFNIVLGSIAAISLLVGGIGIMNIMLATVTERTREIGVRRALGAKQRDITTQFLVEATVLSVGGGSIGVLLGVITPFIVTHFWGMPTIVTPYSVVLAFGISGATGVIFGLYPAQSAAKLDPIEALRHE